MNSVPASVCNVLGFRPDLRMVSNASIKLDPVFLLMGIAHAYLEKTSIQVNKKLFPSLYLLIEDTSTRSACYCSSTPSTITLFLLKRTRGGLCKV